MRQNANLPDRVGSGAGWPKPEEPAKEEKAKGDSLAAIDQEIEKLLRPRAFQVKKFEEGLKKISGRRRVPA